LYRAFCAALELQYGWPPFSMLCCIGVAIWVATLQHFAVLHNGIGHIYILLLLLCCSFCEWSEIVFFLTCFVKYAIVLSIKGVLYGHWTQYQHSVILFWPRLLWNCCVMEQNVIQYTVIIFTYFCVFLYWMSFWLLKYWPSVCLNVINFWQDIWQRLCELIEALMASWFSFVCHLLHITGNVIHVN
jgi:hypothetical protein